MRHVHNAAALASIAMLAACGSETGEQAAARTPAAAPTTIASESIIRPDVVASPVVDLPPDPLAATVGFPGGGATLDARALAILGQVLASEQIAEGWPIALRGHSDSAGSDGDNLAMSRRRADAVAAYLVGRGISAERITVISLGEQRPLAPNANRDGTPDEAGRARNRRVDIEVAPPVAER